MTWIQKPSSRSRLSNKVNDTLFSQNPPALLFLILIFAYGNIRFFLLCFISYLYLFFLLISIRNLLMKPSVPSLPPKGLMGHFLPSIAGAIVSDGVVLTASLFPMAPARRSLSTRTAAMRLHHRMMIDYFRWFFFVLGIDATLIRLGPSFILIHYNSLDFVIHLEFDRMY